MLKHTRTCALLLTLSLPALASSLVEDFSGATINPALYAWSYNNASSGLQGGQYVFNTGSGGGSTGLTTNFLLSGNFTVELHVNQSQTWDGSTSNWSSGAGGFLSDGQQNAIGTWAFTSAGYDASLQDGSTSTNSPHVAWMYPTALRISRTGDEWLFQYQTGGTVWSTALDETDPALTGAWALNLGMWSYGTQPAQLSINYLSITADDFASESNGITFYIFHPNVTTPEPASISLLLAGGLLWPLARRFRNR